jgi:hypothetical protein
VLDCYPKLVAIDEEPDHEIVHGRCLRKAYRAMYETLDPGPHIDVFALDSLHVLFAHDVLPGSEMPLVSAPAVSAEAGDTKRLEQFFELQKDHILTPPKDVCQHVPSQGYQRGSKLLPMIKLTMTFLAYPEQVCHQLIENALIG